MNYYNIPKSFMESLEKESKLKKSIILILENNGVLVKNGLLMTELNSLLINNITDEIIAQLENLISSVSSFEKLTVIDILIDINYSKLKLAKMIIDIIKTESLNNSANFPFWDFCERLRVLKQMSFINEYVELANKKSMGTGRQPLIDLISYSKDDTVNDVLLSFVDDVDVNGHVLFALYRRKYPHIISIAEMFKDDKREFVKKKSRQIIKQYSK